MTSPDTFSALGCNSAVATILARQVDAGQSDANELCGIDFCDFVAMEIARQINGRSGDVRPFEALGLLPELAKAIAGAINAAAEKGKA